MDQYLSTYGKDYVWPYVKKSPSPSSKGEESPYGEYHTCICGAEPGGYMPPREYTSTPVAENYQWSRLEPMGPLLDPKLYPTKKGPVPEFEITQHDQPDTYIRKLEEKYPYLYNVLQSAPPEDMMRRVNEDRLRTTYQVDYGHTDEHPSAEYDKLLAKAGLSPECSKRALMDCRTHVRPPNYIGEPQHPTNESGFGAVGTGFGGQGARDPVNGRGGSKTETTKGARSLAVKAMRNSGGGAGKKDEGGFGTPQGEEEKRPGRIVDDPEAANRPLPAWISEYNEVIGQTGFDIVNDKMHQHGGKSPGRSFLERAIMHCSHCIK